MESDKKKTNKWNVELHDEVKREDFQEIKSIKTLIFILIAGLVSKSFLPIVFYFISIITLETAFYLLKKKDRLKEEKKRSKNEKQTLCLQTKIIDIKEEVFAEYDVVRIISEYKYNDKKSKIFRSEKIKIVEKVWQIGDIILVMVEPDNFDNYRIIID